LLLETLFSGAGEMSAAEDSHVQHRRELLGFLLIDPQNPHMTHKLPWRMSQDLPYSGF
jgi:hypothetical protein